MKAIYLMLAVVCAPAFAQTKLIRSSKLDVTCDFGAQTGKLSFAIDLTKKRAKVSTLTNSELAIYDDWSVADHFDLGGKRLKEVNFETNSRIPQIVLAGDNQDDSYYQVNIFYGANVRVDRSNNTESYEPFAKATLNVFSDGIDGAMTSALAEKCTVELKASEPTSTPDLFKFHLADVQNGTWYKQSDLKTRVTGGDGSDMYGYTVLNDASLNAKQIADAIWKTVFGNTENKIVYSSEKEIKMSVDSIGWVWVEATNGSMGKFQVWVNTDK